MSEASIGIFDSGVGGLTVMRRVMELLPRENIVYFGDTARVPYGNKSPDTILQYSIENMRFLLGHEIKILVIACHTACTAALEIVKSMSPIPVIGMIKPAISQLLECSPCEKIGILGTEQTIRSGVYQNQLSNYFLKEQIVAIACPLFVPLIEQGLTNDILIEQAIRDYLDSYKQEIDTLLLACTHYPLLQNYLRKLLGDKKIIDPALGCSKEIKHVLEEANLLNKTTKDPYYQFFVSKDPEIFSRLGREFLQSPLERIALIS